MSLNRDNEPIEAHLLLWGTEQGLMPRETGKRWEWEIAVGSKDELAAIFQDYDWADEVLHAQNGRKWLMPEFGNRSNMLTAWEKLRERSRKSLDALSVLSKQEEWWSDFMAEVRQHANISGVERGQGRIL